MQSSKHYNYDCPHSEYQKKKKKAFLSQGKKARVPGKTLKFSKRFKRKAKTNLIGVDPSAYAAFIEYNQAYWSQASSLDEEDNEDSKSGSEEEELDF